MDRVSGTARLVEVLQHLIRAESNDSEGTSLPGDVVEVLPAARHHQVVPVLAAHVDLVAGRGGPGHDAVLALARQQRRRVLAASHDLHRVVEALAASDLRGLVLKGLPLAVRSTGSEAGRAVGDVDLLVDPNDIDRVVDALGTAGWCRRPLRGNAIDGPFRRWVRFIDNHEVLVAQGRTSVEVHWRLSQARSTDGLFDELWSGSTSVSVADVHIPVLGPVADAAFNIVHAAKHGFERLKWAVDVARCWIDLDDEQRADVYDTAVGWGSARALRLGVAVVADLGFLDGSPAALAAAHEVSDARTTRFVRDVLDLPVGYRAQRRRRHRVRWALTETWPDRVRHVGEMAWPSDVLSDERVPSVLAVPASLVRPLWRWNGDGSGSPAPRTATESVRGDRPELPDDADGSGEHGEPPPATG